MVISYSKSIIFLLLLTVFIGGMKTSDESAILDASKYIRLIVLVLVILLFFWYQRKVSIKNIFVDNIRYLLVFLSICLLSAVYAGNFTYPIAKSLELFAVIATTSLFISTRLNTGAFVVSTRRWIHGIAVFMLLTSLALNLYWYNALYVYSYTSTTIGSAAVIALLTMRPSMNFGTLVIAAFLLLSLILSYSRTSLGFAFIVLPALYYFQNKLNLWLATPLILTTFSLSIFLFKDALIRNNSTELLLSLSGRLIHWEHALELIRSSPILGYGYYYGVRVVATESYTAREGYEFSTFDNNYLDALVSVGLVGLIPLLLFTLLAFKKGKSYIGAYSNFDTQQNIYSVASLMAVVLFCLLKAMMAPTFVFFHWNQIVMFLACIALHNLGIPSTRYEKK